MSIKGIFQKLMSGGAKKGLSPNEVELSSYIEEERLDRVKALLNEYRIKKNKEILFGNTLVSGGKSIIDADNVFGNVIHAKKLSHNKNIFFTWSYLRRVE